MLSEISPSFTSPLHEWMEGPRRVSLHKKDNRFVVIILNNNLTTTYQLPELRKESCNSSSHFEKIREIFDATFPDQFCNTLLQKIKAESLVKDYSKLNLNDLTAEDIVEMEREIKQLNAPILLANFLKDIPNTSNFQVHPDISRMLYQRYAIHQCFEEFLDLHKFNRSIKCFVSFYEKDEYAINFLNRGFISDLEKAGIPVITPLNYVGPKGETFRVDSLIRETSHVIMLCTPLSKHIAVNGKLPGLSGFKQQIRLASNRSQNNNFVQVILKGDKKSACEWDLWGWDTLSDEAISFCYYTQFLTLISYLSQQSFVTSSDLFNEFEKKIKLTLDAPIDKAKIDLWKTNWALSNQKALYNTLNRTLNKIQYCNIPQSNEKNPIFRQQSFQMLIETIEKCHKNGKIKVCITGQVGIGKSELAFLYAHQFRGHFDSVATLRISHFNEDLQLLIENRHLKEPTPREISKSLEGLSYLIIIDGVDDDKSFDMIEPYLPIRNGLILATSQNSARAEHGDYSIMKLQPFQIEEAVNYILNKTGSQEKNEALTLAENLGFHPLALSEAVKYISFNKLSLKAYNEELENKGIQQKSILEIWNSSLNLIKTLPVGPLTIQLLNFLSCFNREVISFELINVWCKVFHSKKYNGLDVDLSLWYLVSEKSLIDSDKNDFCNLNPLLQRVIYQQMSFQDRFTTAMQAVILTLNLYEDPKYSAILKPHCKKLWKILNKLETEIAKESPDDTILKNIKHRLTQ